ncbi:MAG: FAD/NAD(P)-binding protein, partial [Chloroflexota bacterium]
MLDWLIIGGGVIGTTISNYLVTAYGVTPARVRVLDPHPAPLDRWTRFTAATGMRYLRSPQVHHIDINGRSLMGYSQDAAHNDERPFIAPLNRPSYSLFQAHAAHVIEQNHLADLRLQGAAHSMISTRGGYVVETDQGNIRTKRVVLAIGRTALNIPVWAEPSREQGAPVQHIFERAFTLGSVRSNERVAVVGGGVTAGQVALSLAERLHTPPVLITRHTLRQADFDSSPCWLGPKCSAWFRHATHPHRRKLIANARNQGTMPRDVYLDVRKGFKTSQLGHCQSEIKAVT